MSTDQVIKPVNLDALSSWFGEIPKEILDEMDTLAPMLSRLGYDTQSQTPNYGKPDAKVKENTDEIRRNRKFWSKLAKNVSEFA